VPQVVHPGSIQTFFITAYPLWSIKKQLNYKTLFSILRIIKIVKNMAHISFFYWQET
jgi:hypothetical protein